MLSITLKLLIIAFINFQLYTCSTDIEKIEVEEMIFSVPISKPRNRPQIKEKKLKKLLEPLGKLYKTSSDVGIPISQSKASLSVEKMIVELNRLIQTEYSYLYKRYHKLKTVHQAEKCDSTTNVYTLTLQKTDCEPQTIIEGSPSTNCSAVEDRSPISCTILSKVASADETIVGAFCRANMQKAFSKKESICELSRYPGEEKFKTFVPKEVSSWFSDAIVYIPQGHKPQPNTTYFKNYRGRQGIVGRGMLPHLGPVRMHVVTIFRKNGEKTEVLSLLNSKASIEIPKVFVTHPIDRPFGDEIDHILRKAFDTMGLNSAQKEEKLQKLYNAIRDTTVVHRETPYDTDDAYVITNVVAVLDESKEHIGSIDEFPSEKDLQIGWKVADKSAKLLMRFVMPSKGFFQNLFSEVQLLF